MARSSYVTTSSRAPKSPRRFDVTRCRSTADPFVLLGRRTYDIFASHWPKVTEPGADLGINNARKYVASNRPLATNWNNTAVRLRKGHRRGCSKAGGRVGTGAPGPRQRDADSDAAPARPGRRAVAQDLPGHARRRPQVVRRRHAPRRFRSHRNQRIGQWRHHRQVQARGRGKSRLVHGADVSPGPSVALAGGLRATNLCTQVPHLGALRGTKRFSCRHGEARHRAGC